MRDLPSPGGDTTPRQSIQQQSIPAKHRWVLNTLPDVVGGEREEVLKKTTVFIRGLLPVSVLLPLYLRYLTHISNSPAFRVEVQSLRRALSMTPIDEGLDKKDREIAYQQFFRRWGFSPDELHTLFSEFVEFSRDINHSIEVNQGSGRADNFWLGRFLGAGDGENAQKQYTTGQFLQDTGVAIWIIKFIQSFIAVLPSTLAEIGDLGESTSKAGEDISNTHSAGIKQAYSSSSDVTDGASGSAAKPVQSQSDGGESSPDTPVAQTPSQAADLIRQSSETRKEIIKVRSAVIFSLAANAGIDPDKNPIAFEQFSREIEGSVHTFVMHSLYGTSGVDLQSNAGRLKFLRTVLLQAHGDPSIQVALFKQTLSPEEQKKSEKEIQAAKNTDELRETLTKLQTQAKEKGVPSESIEELAATANEKAEAGNVDFTLLDPDTPSTIDQRVSSIEQHLKDRLAEKNLPNSEIEKVIRTIRSFDPVDSALLSDSAGGAQQLLEALSQELSPSTMRVLLEVIPKVELVALIRVLATNYGAQIQHRSPTPPTGFAEQHIGDPNTIHAATRVPLSLEELEAYVANLSDYEKRQLVEYISQERIGNDLRAAVDTASMGSLQRAFAKWVIPAQSAKPNATSTRVFKIINYSTELHMRSLWLFVEPQQESVSAGEVYAFQDSPSVEENQTQQAKQSAFNFDLGLFSKDEGPLSDRQLGKAALLAGVGILGTPAAVVALKAGLDKFEAIDGQLAKYVPGYKELIQPAIWQSVDNLGKAVKILFALGVVPTILAALALAANLAAFIWALSKNFTNAAAFIQRNLTPGVLNSVGSGASSATSGASGLLGQQLKNVGAGVASATKGVATATNTASQALTTAIDGLPITPNAVAIASGSLVAGVMLYQMLTLGVFLTPRSVGSNLIEYRQAASGYFDRDQPPNIGCLEIVDDRAMIRRLNTLTNPSAVRILQFTNAELEVLGRVGGRIFASERFTSLACQGTVKIARGSGREWGGWSFGVFEGDQLIILYGAGIADYGVGVYTLAHELGHVIQKTSIGGALYGAYLRAQFAGVGWNPTNPVYLPTYSAPSLIKTEDTAKKESFAEAIGLFASQGIYTPRTPFNFRGDPFWSTSYYWVRDNLFEGMEYR